MEEREMCYSWLVKSPKKEVQQLVPTPSIWEDDFRAFFDLADEENPPLLHQPDCHFQDVNVMENNKVSNLNLNLNYEEVLEAWSDRGSLWASASDPTHVPYVSRHSLLHLRLIII